MIVTDHELLLRAVERQSSPVLRVFEEHVAIERE
jgi:hypothetical protein